MDYEDLKFHFFSCLKGENMPNLELFVTSPVVYYIMNHINSLVCQFSQDI